LVQTCIAQSEQNLFPVLGLGPEFKTCRMNAPQLGQNPASIDLSMGDPSSIVPLNITLIYHLKQ
jgi:hypothetical protein